MSAAVTLPSQSFTDRPLRLRLNVALTLSDRGAGAPSEQDTVQLLDIAGKGLAVGLPKGAFPMTIGPPSPEGQTYDLQLNVTVGNCPTAFQQSRRLDVRAQRPGQPAASVPTEVSPAAINALESLVTTTCRGFLG